MARLLIPDSCALGAAYFHETASLNARPLLAAIKSLQFEVAAPVVLLSEFLNICRKKMQGSSSVPAVPPSTVEAVLADFFRLPIVYFSLDAPLTSEAWRFHRTHHVGTNDAYFLILAHTLDGEVWTSDTPLCTNARGVHPAVYDLNVRQFA